MGYNVKKLIKSDDIEGMNKYHTITFPMLKLMINTDDVHEHF